MSADALTIRPATPADSTALDELLAASYATLLAGHYDAETLSRALAPMSRANPRLIDSGTYYVAEICGTATEASAAQPAARLVACGGWTAEQPGTGTAAPGEAHIRHFATRPDWIGRGVGTRLLAHCINEAAALGRTTLTCFSTLNAAPFYGRSGFVTLGPLDVTLTPGVIFPAILMRRTG